MGSLLLLFPLFQSVLTAARVYLKNNKKKTPTPPAHKTLVVIPSHSQENCLSVCRDPKVLPVLAQLSCWSPVSPGSSGSTLLHLFLSFAAAAAESLQSCPTLCDPIDSSPPGSPVPGILQARTLEWVAIAFSNA